MPHLTLLTYGSRGDVQPFVALGVGLREAGYGVKVAAPAAFEDFVTGYGLDFVALPGDPTELVANLVQQAGGNYLKATRAVLEFTVPLALETLDAARVACAGTDGIVSSVLLAVAAHELAASQGVPHIAGLLYPLFTPTGNVPVPMLPERPRWPVWYRFLHRLFAAMFWQGNRLSYGWLRRRYPERDLPPLSGWPFAARTTTLYAYSPQVIPHPTDWPAHAHTTGYWFLNQAEWQPPADLAAFLADGPPPVYIGFGSTVAADMDRLGQMVLGALRLTGQRGLLASGWGGLASGEVSLPDDVFVLDHAPHDWLFPRMAALVHHGGAGTSAESLRAGVPTVVTPFASDQFFWARRIHEAGVGPPPLPGKRLTLDKLVNAINVATSDTAMRERAAALGERIRAEDGVVRAVEIIRRVVG